MLLLCLILLVLGVLPGWAATDSAYRLEDPAGDDYGPGTYIYPKSRAFAPYKGLFDLLSLAVDYDAQEVRFEVTLAELRNTWRAPEGFSHQLIEIYICRGGRGRTATLAPGAFVRFSPDHPWDAMLKAAPWECSKLVVLDERGQAVESPLLVGPAGERTVRLRAPLTVLGKPAASWLYYVLIGSYDGFGEDNFRPVMAKAGDWHLGGGRDDAWDPNVLDILAPGNGRYAQKQQLGGFDPERGRLATLMPMGPDFLPGKGGPAMAIPLILGALVLAAAFCRWYASALWERLAGGAREILDRLFKRTSSRAAR